MGSLAASSESSEALDIRPITGRIGAEIAGLRRSGDVAKDVFTSTIYETEHRATQPQGIDDNDEPRIVRHVSLAGAAAVAIDGRRSTIRRKAPSLRPAA